MTKLDGKSLDIKEQNIELLKELYPEVFSEGKIDFIKLQEELGEFTDKENERYNFTWNGKQEAKRIAQTPSTGTLRPCKEESKNWDTTQNLYIEGDNLEVLKLLQKSYHKKVKMIYIDPPYNTGKDFVYKDNFRDNIKNYMEQTGQINSDGNRLSTNSDTNGRYHSDWLSMMYPRLKLARNLLKDDGVIFISIDDNEVGNLRNLCNEVVGEDNFIATTARVSNAAKNNVSQISITHEYSLVYAKSKYLLKDIWTVNKKGAKEFQTYARRLFKQGLSIEEIEKELKALTKYPRFYEFDHFYYCDSRGVYQTDNPGGVTSGNIDSEILHPITKEYCKKPNGGWRYKEDKIKLFEKENRWHFGNDSDTIPRVKRYLDECLTSKPNSVHFFDSQTDSKWLSSEKLPFDFPKPLDYLKYMISMSVSGNDLILDFFSGSATTAHAIMQLNMEDTKSRRYILVQLPEDTNDKNFPTICDIGKERIRRAGEKIIADNPDKDLSNLDIGFKVYKLDSSNIKEWDSDFDNLEINLLDAVDNIKSDRTSEDLLYEILLKYGLDLTLPIEELSIEGKIVYNIGFGALVVCLDDNITIEVVEAIAEFIKEQVVYDEEKKKRHARVVFKDKSFADTNVKTNAIQILKQFDIDEIVSI